MSSTSPEDPRAHSEDLAELVNAMSPGPEERALRWEIQNAVSGVDVDFTNVQAHMPPACRVVRLGVTRIAANTNTQEHFADSSLQQAYKDLASVFRDVPGFVKGSLDTWDGSYVIDMPTDAIDIGTPDALYYAAVFHAARDVAEKHGCTLYLDAAGSCKVIIRVARQRVGARSVAAE